MSKKFVLGPVLAALALLVACTNGPSKSDTNGSGAGNGAKASAIDLEGKGYAIDINKVDISIPPVEAAAGRPE